MQVFLSYSDLWGEGVHSHDDYCTVYTSLIMIMMTIMIMVVNDKYTSLV